MEQTSNLPYPGGDGADIVFQADAQPKVLIGIVDNGDGTFTVPALSEKKKFISKLQAALAYDDAVLANHGELETARSVAGNGAKANGALKRVHRSQKLNFPGIGARARAVNAVFNENQLDEASGAVASIGTGDMQVIQGLRSVEPSDASQGGKQQAPAASSLQLGDGSLSLRFAAASLAAGQIRPRSSASAETGTSSRSGPQLPGAGYTITLGDHVISNVKVSDFDPSTSKGRFELKPAAAGGGLEQVGVPLRSGALEAGETGGGDSVAMESDTGPMHSRGEPMVKYDTGSALPVVSAGPVDVVVGSSQGPRQGALRYAQAYRGDAGVMGALRAAQEADSIAQLGGPGARSGARGGGASSSSAAGAPWADGRREQVWGAESEGGEGPASGSTGGTARRRAMGRAPAPSEGHFDRLLREDDDEEEPGPGGAAGAGGAGGAGGGSSSSGLGQQQSQTGSSGPSALGGIGSSGKGHAVSASGILVASEGQRGEMRAMGAMHAGIEVAPAAARAPTTTGSGAGWPRAARPQTHRELQEVLQRSNALLQLGALASMMHAAEGDEEEDFIDGEVTPGLHSGVATSAGTNTAGLARAGAAHLATSTGSRGSALLIDSSSGTGWIGGRARKRPTVEDDEMQALAASEALGCLKGALDERPLKRSRKEAAACLLPARAPPSMAVSARSSTYSRRTGGNRGSGVTTRPVRHTAPAASPKPVFQPSEPQAQVTEVRSSSGSNAAGAAAGGQSSSSVALPGLDPAQRLFGVARGSPVAVKEDCDAQADGEEESQQQEPMMSVSGRPMRSSAARMVRQRQQQSTKKPGRPAKLPKVAVAHSTAPRPVAPQSKAKRRDGGMPNDVYVYMKLKTLMAVQLMGFRSAEGDKDASKVRLNYKDLPKSVFCGVYPTPRGIWTGRYRNRSCGVFYEEEAAAIGRDVLLVCMQHRLGDTPKPETLNYPKRYQEMMARLTEVDCAYAVPKPPPAGADSLSEADCKAIAELDLMPADARKRGPKSVAAIRRFLEEQDGSPSMQAQQLQEGMAGSSGLLALGQAASATLAESETAADTVHGITAVSTGRRGRGRHRGRGRGARGRSSSRGRGQGRQRGRGRGRPRNASQSRSISHQECPVSPMPHFGAPVEWKGSSAPPGRRDGDQGVLAEGMMSFGVEQETYHGKSALQDVFGSSPTPRTARQAAMLRSEVVAVTPANQTTQARSAAQTGKLATPAIQGTPGDQSVAMVGSEDFHGEIDYSQEWGGGGGHVLPDVHIPPMGVSGSTQDRFVRRMATKPGQSDQRRDGAQSSSQQSSGTRLPFESLHSDKQSQSQHQNVRGAMAEQRQSGRSSPDSLADAAAAVRHAMLSPQLQQLGSSPVVRQSRAGGRTRADRLRKESRGLRTKGGERKASTSGRREYSLVDLAKVAHSSSSEPEDGPAEPAHETGTRARLFSPQGSFNSPSMGRGQRESGRGRERQPSIPPTWMPTLANLSSDSPLTVDSSQRRAGASAPSSAVRSGIANDTKAASSSSSSSSSSVVFKGMGALSEATYSSDDPSATLGVGLTSASRAPLVAAASRTVRAPASVNSGELPSQAYQLASGELGGHMSALALLAGTKVSVPPSAGINLPDRVEQELRLVQGVMDLDDPNICKASPAVDARGSSMRLEDVREPLLAGDPDGADDAAKQ